MADWPTDAELVAAVCSSPALSAATRTTYVRQLSLARRLLASHAPSSEGRELASILSAPGPCLAALDASPMAPNTRKSLLGALVGLYRRAEAMGVALPPRAPWSEALCAAQASAHASLAENASSAREQAAHASLAEWAAAEAHAARSEGFGSMEHLLVSMQSPANMAPLRGGDLFDVALDDGPASARLTPEGDTWRLVVREHKTARSHGALQRVLPKGPAEALRASLLLHPRGTLFLNHSGRRFASRSTFVNWKNRTLRRVFGRRVTTNSARHAFVSELDRGRMSLAARNKVAAAMGHSLMTQEEYVRLN